MRSALSFGFERGDDFYALINEALTALGYFFREPECTSAISAASLEGSLRVTVRVLLDGAANRMKMDSDGTLVKSVNRVRVMNLYLQLATSTLSTLH